MNRDALIDAINDLIAEWQITADQFRKEGHNHRAYDYEDCIDDLRGILPPEE